MYLLTGENVHKFFRRPPSISGGGGGDSRAAMITETYRNVVAAAINAYSNTDLSGCMLSRLSSEPMQPEFYKAAEMQFAELQRRGLLQIEINTGMRIFWQAVLSEAWQTQDFAAHFWRGEAQKERDKWRAAENTGREAASKAVRRRGNKAQNKYETALNRAKSLFIKREGNYGVYLFQEFFDTGRWNFEGTAEPFLREIIVGMLARKRDNMGWAEYRARIEIDKDEVVYAALCIPTGKMYIGQTIRGLKARRNQHESDARRGAETLLHCALRKHGAENFRWRVLAHACGESSLDMLENAYIAVFNTLAPHGYNSR